MSNNFIQSTKKFFNKKPVRIIFAIIVIASIMTGIGFAIIALVGALSDPCSKQPGTVWSDDVKSCIPAQCDGNLPVCLKKGSNWYKQCPPINYCDSSTPEGYNYKYDTDSCECILDCSSLGEDYDGFTPDGKFNSISMKKDGNNYIPEDNDLICGYKCDFSDKNFCTSDFYCAIHKVYNPVTKTTTVENKGCLPKNDYVLCSSDNTIACHSQSDCTKDDNNNTVCKFNYCGYDDPNNVIACTKDSDCGEGNYFKGMCSEEIKTKNGISKQFHKVKYCRETEKSSGNSYCINKYRISENKNLTVNNKCKDLKLTDGVSLKNPQCSNSFDIEGCAKFGMCDNSWQASPNSAKSYCYPKNNKIPNELSSGSCCDSGFQSSDPLGNKFCCIKQNNPKCLNITEHPYSKKMLLGLGKFTDDIDCPSDSTILDEYNKKLHEKLNIQSLNPNDKNSHYYTQLYCDPNTNKLKAWCGQDSDSINLTTVNGHSTSFCTQKDKKCNLTGQNWLNSIQLGEVTVPICKFGSQEEEYWSTPVNSEQQGFHTTFTTDKNPDCPTPSIELCAQSTYNNLDSVTDINLKGDNSCEFTVNCNEYNLSLPTKSSDNQHIKWDELINSNTYKKYPNINYSKIFDSKFISQANPSQNPPCTGSNFDLPDDITKSFFQLQKSGSSSWCTANSKQVLDNLLSSDGKICKKGIGDNGYCKK